MGLYDDLPEVTRAEAGARAREGGEGAAGGWGGTTTTTTTEATTEATTTKKGGASEAMRAKGAIGGKAGVLRAQANALRAARSRTLRDAEARRAESKKRARERKEDSRGGEDEVKTIEVAVASDEEETDDVDDGYDPAAPNDYERTLAERAERARRRRDLNANEELRKELESERKAMESQRSAMDREEVLGVDGREARRRRLAMGRDAGASRDTNSASGAQKANKGKSAAEKMMEKMGWTKGRGLGKSEQGMTTPLEVRKDSATSGKIVNAAPVIFEKKKVPLRGKPTPVLLLRNVVLAGEVVDTLEDDVAEHCEKFGDVVRVFIFEIEEEGFAKEETVRIFVEFVDTKTAISAGAELDGRVFANRVVKASYYDVERFEAGDLGPQAGET